MEMTMSTTMKANAELEPRPLEAHELDMSGGGIPVQQIMLRNGRALGYGPVELELYYAWAMAPINSPVKVPLFLLK
jgi:hypothetical protein